MTTREDVPVSTAAASPIAPPTAWNWPRTPLSNRYGTTVTEIFDNAADRPRVAVITVHEDAGHVRRGTVTKVELVLEFRAPARIVVWADLAQEPA
jgi:hypothetical protein